MKMLIYVGDLVSDVPGLSLGSLLARHLEAEATLFHVAPKERKKKKARKEGQEILEKAKTFMEGYPVETRVRRGNVARKILAEVEENQHDMVVVTAARIGSFPQSVSVSREILPKMPCCVLVAKNPKPEINNILVLTGGQKISESMITISARLACALSAQVTLMHVAANVPTMYTGLETIEETLEELLQTATPVAKHLRRCARILDRFQVASELKLKHGDAVYEIVREIDREDYDLVILGASRAAEGIKGWFLGNITKDIIEFVEMPVMVVNQEHAEKMDDSTV